MRTLGPLPDLLGGGSGRGVQPAVEEEPSVVGGCCRVLKGAVFPPTFSGREGRQERGRGGSPDTGVSCKESPFPPRQSCVSPFWFPQRTHRMPVITTASSVRSKGRAGGQVSGGPRFPRPRQPQPQAESKPTVRPLGGQGPQTPQPRPLLQTSGLCVIPWRVRGPQQVGKGASTRVSHLLRDGFHVTPTQGHQEHPPALSCCQGWGPPDAALGSKSVGTLLSKLQITSALWT